MSTNPHTGRYVLYGAPVSLYTGKARSYLRKQGIDFVEVGPGSDRYLNVIVPAVGRWIIPCLETPDGEIVQDGADIIKHFETGPGADLRAYPDAYPATAAHRAISHVFEMFGGEGLLRPAIHYRWNFNDVNLEFLRAEFALLTPAGFDPEQQSAAFDHSSGRMRKAASGFGVTPESAPLIEESFQEFLRFLSRHLETSPYLLGGAPTLGDYCLMGAMWAHLFRDPAPQQLIKQVAPRVGRWVERMSTSEPYDHEFGDHSGRFFADDGVPDTLRDMLRFVEEEYLNEITAHVAFANEWLSAHPDIVAGTNGKSNPASRGIGAADFEWRGLTLTTGVMPYRLWLLQHLTDDFAEAPNEDQERVRAIFADVGLEQLLNLRVNRRVERTNHLEVWGPV
jgi:glutathione S-transferase